MERAPFPAGEASIFAANHRTLVFSLVGYRLAPFGNGKGRVPLGTQVFNAEPSAHFAVADGLLMRMRQSLKPDIAADAAEGMSSGRVTRLQPPA